MMPLETVIAELKSTLAAQLDIFGRATLEVKESSAIINKTQAAIAALEGNPLSGYEGFSGRTYPGSIEENAELFNKLGQPMDTTTGGDSTRNNQKLGVDNKALE